MNEILDTLTNIEQDSTVPRNIREKIKDTITILENKDDKLRIEKSLEDLGDIAEDANVPSYARMQIWSIVSQLETLK
tara:strand:+ start:428 stop:658 length:231 start_codon:yes stop_codon:yes gene_type:complete